MTKSPAVDRFAVVKLDEPHEPDVNCEEVSVLSARDQEQLIIFTPAKFAPPMMFRKLVALG
jgi:hypothetical protein